MSDQARDYLKRLIARKTTEPDDEDELFYRDHRLELKEKPSLKARWDRFIYGAPVETEDFISGMAQCLQALSTRTTEFKAQTDRNLGQARAQGP